jgi:sugar lactone lactonase YvrE
VGTFPVVVTATPAASPVANATTLVTITVNPVPPLLYVTDADGNGVSAVSGSGSVRFLAGGVNTPVGIAIDAAGNLYTADEGDSIIARVSTSGVVSTFAADGNNLSPVGLAFDTSGNLYVANYNEGTVDRISPAGNLTTFASGFKQPAGIAFDAAGNLYVADETDNMIFKVTPGGTVSIFAVPFSDPSGLAFDSDGNLFVTELSSNTIDEVSPNGKVSFFSSSGLSGPADLAFDGSGNLYVTNIMNDTVSVFAPGSATSTTFATGFSGPAFLSTGGYAPAPRFTVNPVSQTIAAGRSVVFSVQAAGAPSPTYQWTFNGVPILGAEDPVLLLTAVTAASAGTYSCVAYTSGGSVTSSPATLSVVPVSTPAHLINLSARGYVGVGANALIGGFVIAGSGSKDLLIRGIGPGLNYAFNPFPGFVPNPLLALFNPSQSQIGRNSGWNGAETLVSAFSSLGAFGLSPTSSDAALLASLAVPPSGFTAQVTSGVGGDGTGLVEVYDADSRAPAVRLVNISARALVQTGQNVLIGGFAIGGSTNQTVLIRAVGPGLTDTFQLTGTLAQPVLTLFAGSTPIASNTNWGGDAAIAAAASAVGAFPLNPGHQDSALLVTLAPGGYTAEITGANGGAGIALVEIYEVY